MIGIASQHKQSPKKAGMHSYACKLYLISNIDAFPRYNGSISKCLESLFPNFDWQTWRFQHLPSGSLSDTRHLELAFQSVARLLGVKINEQWYDVTAESFSNEGCGSSVLEK